MLCMAGQVQEGSRNSFSTAQKEKKRKYYAFQRNFNEKPSIIPGYPGCQQHTRTGDLRV